MLTVKQNLERKKQRSMKECSDGKRMRLAVQNEDKVIKGDRSDGVEVLSSQRP